MTLTPRPVLLALVAGLLLAGLATGCAAGGSSAETADVFQAAPWTNGESLEYRVLNSDGDVIGSGTLASEVESGSMVLRQRYVEANPPAGGEPITDEVEVYVNASTFRPEGGVRTTSSRDEDDDPTFDRWSWTYGADDDGDPVVTIEHFEGAEDDDPSEETLRLRDHYYDNESSLWLWRSIELVEELEVFYVSVNALEASQQTVSLRVPQLETVTVPAGEFQAYRLLLRNGRAVRTAWIEADAPHRVLRWDNGASILELLP